MLSSREYSDVMIIAFHDRLRNVIRFAQIISDIFRSPNISESFNNNARDVSRAVIKQNRIFNTRSTDTHDSSSIGPSLEACLLFDDHRRCFEIAGYLRECLVSIDKIF